MAQDIVNRNQNLSYTNLDFSSVYPETLDLIKQLTYRWDPSISDESDPGVILVKLSALIADKCNYNIDKSILEAFPLSVTQEANARQLYEQLGYYMDWYESSTAPIVLNWTGDTTGDIETYTIPKFSIITDSDSAHNYALIGVKNEDSLVVSDGKLTTDGKQIYMIAMEGTPAQYTFLGESIITPQMVDDNNRLYLSTQYASQNGVFIKNTGQENYADWKRVTNLYEQSFNELRYKFGYDSVSNLCYLEFPDNYSELFGSGIEITYMIISSEYNAIPAQNLTQFLTSITPAENSEVSLSSSNVKINNYYAASGHKDKESINDAYIGYKKTVGTFNTLITLRDYLNYILSNDESICSNGFVCDRTNDIQSTYKIVSKENGLDTIDISVEDVKDGSYNFIQTTDTVFNSSKTYYELINKIFTKTTDTTFSPTKIYYEAEANTEDILTPFSLKFYLLQNAVSLNSKSAYDETFDMLKESPDLSVLLEDTAHLEHTYENILSYGKNTYKVTSDTTWLDNKAYYFYNTESKIYTIINDSYFILTSDTTWETKDYYKFVLSSKSYKKINRSDYLETDTPNSVGLYELILAGSTNPHQSGLYEIDAEYLLPHVAFYRAKYPISMSISTYSSVGTSVQSDILTNIINALYQNTNSHEVYFGEAISMDYLTETVKNSDTRIKNVAFENIDYTIEAVYFDENNNKFISTDLPVISSNISPSSYTDESMIDRYQIAKDIICKSILAGTTQLLIPDTQFNYHLSQRYITYVNNVMSITSEARIIIDNCVSAYSSANTIKKSYTLRQNEVVTLFRPTLNSTKSFSSGIHYEYLLLSNIEANQSHQLKDGEYVFFYQSSLNSDGDIIGYTTTTYKAGAIIKPSFTMKSISSIASLSSYAQSKLIPDILAVTENYRESYTDNLTRMSEIKNSSSIINNVISGSQTIDIQELSTATITQDSGYKMYWVLNNATYSNDNNIKNYVLFDSFNPSTQATSNNTINSYTLKSGEYLYCIDAAGADLQIFGAGTTITRNCGIQSTLIEETSTPYEYVKYSDIISDEGKEKYNFEIIIYNSNGTSYASPVLNGFYEKVDNVYVRSVDTAYDSSKIYYMLLMKSASGLYKKVTTVNDEGKTVETSVATEDVTTSIFSKVNLISDLIDVDPSARGLYELIANNGNSLRDIYTLTGNDYEGTYNRYAKTLDKSIISRTLFDNDTYRSVNVNDISTYKSITIKSSDTGDYKPSHFNPAEQGWLVPNYASNADVVFNDYYTKNNNVYTLVPKNSQTISDNPSFNGWYKKTGDTYTLSTDVFSFTPNKYKKITYSTVPFELATSTYNENILNKGYFYKAASTNDTFIYDSTLSHAKFRLDSSQLNSFDTLYTGAIASDIAADSLLVTLDNRWDSSIINSKPSTWGLSSFTDTGNSWTAGSSDTILDSSFVLVSLADMTTASIIKGILATTTIYPNANIIVSGSLQEGCFVSLKTISNYVPEGKVYKIYNKADLDVILNSPGTGITSANILACIHDITTTITVNNSAVSKAVILEKLVVYYLPLLYKFINLYRFVDKDYYEIDTYYRKSFSAISAWSCPALSLDDISEDPLTIIKTDWQPIQDNTSITIIENELWSLSEKDIISFEAPATRAQEIIWPILGNKEVILDLDKYNVSYKKADADFVDVEQLTIPGCDWKCYSSLLLNTNNTTGQQLLDNQYITLYDNSTPVKVLNQIKGEFGTTITFQLAYPVSNVAGSNIMIATTSTAGVSIPNSVYVFKTLYSTDQYAYVTDTYQTYLYFNKENTVYDNNSHEINVPVNLPFGNYLLPFTGIDEVPISVKYVQEQVHNNSSGISTTVAINDNIKSVTSPTINPNLKIGFSEEYTNLGSYIDNSIKIFEGNKYYFVQLDIPQYVLIHSPELVSSVYNLSPSALGWYEISESGYVLSNATSVGENLLTAYTTQETDNPKELQLYEKTDTVYSLSTDLLPTQGKTYYKSNDYYLELSDSDNYLKFILDDSIAVPVILVLDDIFKYNNNPLFGEQFDEIASKVKELDIDSQYNYSFIPKDADLITDPLVPKTFWNTSHIANKFTIPKLDFGETEAIEYKFIT